MYQIGICWCYDLVLLILSYTARGSLDFYNRGKIVLISVGFCREVDIVHRFD